MSAAVPAEPRPEPDDPALVPVLPEAVRQRVVTLAANVLGGLPGDDVPPVLRRIARFAPQRRARLGATSIAATLSADPLFRQRVAGVIRDAGNDLTAAVAAGTSPAAADPVEVGALAYLLRPDNWIDLVAGSAEAVRNEADRDATEQRVKDAEQRADRAEQARAAAVAEQGRLRAEAADARAELDAARTELRAVQKELRETQRRERRAVDTLSADRGRAARAERDHEAELRRLRAKLADAEAAAASARAHGTKAHAFDDARAWLLLETIRNAARGLVRELALDPVDLTPADFVAETADAPGGERASERALASDDPARLDQLLALPRAHMIVDGYNVTKTGYGELSLEQQRNRLVGALGALAARTGAEVTCVWDGAEPVHGVAPPPRGVRVLFSRKGETADEVIRRLVRAEPDGRVLVVISSDKEVADGTRRHGAYPLSAYTLIRRLARA
ncbi:NYN domain-containing protein [Actinocatenispora rupis]|uniref:RNA-binding protein n=1 Tax=Actinocatenispora rupis TaxID=519421 RepID=A0A8J3JCI6_9ACTN|nr:NYN domain-containing protein [Actinocatenispora rupis]GID13483.1 RNA-binding protein [Actinocatenispora rupis]